MTTENKELIRSVFERASEIQERADSPSLRPRIVIENRTGNGHFTVKLQPSLEDAPNNAGSLPS